jgi:glycosyltransferase involved in cell wall biosynthesis
MGDHQLDAAGSGGTLHVVDRLSEPVFSLLGPAANALREAGMVQTVVLLDRPEHAQRLRQFGKGVNIVPVPTGGPGWRPWAALRRQVREQLRLQQPATVHYHGALAWLCSLGVAQREQSVFVTPHGSTFARLAGALLRLQRAAPSWAPTAVASSQFDTLMLQLDGSPPPLVEGVVPDRFLNAPRREAERPLVVAGDHRGKGEAIDLLCRVAVVFGAAELNLSFHWCGPALPDSAARLRAAGIQLEAGDPLRHLRRAWVYFAGGEETQFPVRLAQAMACGLPCLAADVAAHRGLIDDGRTGLLFRSAEEAAQMLTALIDDADLRQRLGEAARTVARQRFSEQRLRRDLAALYARPLPAR